MGRIGSLLIIDIFDHPDLHALIQRIIDVANRSHVAAGSWFGKREQMQRTIKQGSRFVVYSNDCAFGDALAPHFAANL